MVLRGIFKLYAISVDFGDESGEENLFFVVNVIANLKGSWIMWLVHLVKL